MRKVFISTLSEHAYNSSAPIVNYSNTLDLLGRNFHAPISHLLDMNTAPGDAVLIITGADRTPAGLERYRTLEEELRGILTQHHATAEFVVVDQPAGIGGDATIFGRVFKEIADCLQEGDEIYADATYGMKCYTLSMFVALHYLSKACQNTKIACLLYGELQKAESGLQRELIDVTNLVHLNHLVGAAHAGEKARYDDFFQVMLN